MWACAAGSCVGAAPLDASCYHDGRSNCDVRMNGKRDGVSETPALVICRRRCAQDVLLVLQLAVGGRHRGRATERWEHGDVLGCEQKTSGFA